MSKTAILIAARNAERTIGRAIRSAVDQGDYPILLVDDFSSDETVNKARIEGRGRLTVVRPPFHGPLGLTRQTALDHLPTACGAELQFCVWLDADDESLPGRVDRMTRAMESGADVVADGLELRGGASGQLLREITIPVFLRNAASPVRLFERNYLPGPGVIGVRLGLARAVGYDVTMHGAEDYDFLLRLLAAGARFALLDEIGYRSFAYPSSLSRDLANQQEQCRMALLKHDYGWVRARLAEAGVGADEAGWTLVAMAVQRREYDTAWRFLAGQSWAEALASGHWRRDFTRGTLRLLIGDASGARRWLEDAEAQAPTAEGANNLGVALAMLGDVDGARDRFAAALVRFPDYLDARLNVDRTARWRITSLPLRRYPNRDRYNDPDRLREGWGGPKGSSHIIPVVA